MDTRLYPAHVFWSAEDEGFIASAADLPGCSAFGTTQEEAVRELQDAISAWIEAARAAGNPVPSPSAPGPKSAYSGKFLVRMPSDLHAELAATAEAQGTSLNQYVVYLLAKRQVDGASVDRPSSPPSPKGTVAGVSTHDFCL